MPLREKLGAIGMTAVVDERDIKTGQVAGVCIKAACQTARLVIFVITREFLRSSYCMDELRWALEQREHSNFQQPMILPLLYPANVMRGYSSAQLDSMSLTDHQTIRDMLTAGTIEVDQLRPLHNDLRRLIEHNPVLQISQAAVPSQQRIRDLEELAGFCLQRADACGR